MSAGRPRTDAELIAAAGRRPHAFGELYDRHAAQIYGWVRRSGLGEADRRNDDAGLDDAVSTATPVPLGQGRPFPKAHESRARCPEQDSNLRPTP